jgi:hypothetical protein
VLNPDRIVLGGLYADLLRASRCSCAPGWRTGPSSTRRRRRPASGGPSRTGLVGAAELALQPLLDDPRRAAMTRSASRAGTMRYYVQFTAAPAASSAMRWRPASSGCGSTTPTTAR